MVTMVMPILILVNSVWLLVSCSTDIREKSNSKMELGSIISLKDSKDFKLIYEDSLLNSNYDTYYPEEYDQGIDGICSLFNSKNLNKKVLANYEANLFQADEIFIVNQDMYCRLHIVNGGEKGEFQSAIIGYIKDLPEILNFKVLLYEETFKTNNGFSLGMTLEEFDKLFSLKTKCEKITKDNTIEFVLSDSYNVYRASYKFFDNQLVELSFGYSED